MMPNKKLDNTPAESIQDSALSSPSHKLLRQLTKMPKKKLILDNKITKQFTKKKPPAKQKKDETTDSFSHSAANFSSSDDGSIGLKNYVRVEEFQTFKDEVLHIQRGINQEILEMRGDHDLFTQENTNILTQLEKIETSISN